LLYKQLGEGQSTQRVLRGGSWNNKPRNLRSANRNNNTPDNRNNNNGFRLAQAQWRAAAVSEPLQGTPDPRCGQLHRQMFVSGWNI